VNPKKGTILGEKPYQIRSLGGTDGGNYEYVEPHKFDLSTTAGVKEFKSQAYTLSYPQAAAFRRNCDLQKYLQTGVPVVKARARVVVAHIKHDEIFLITNGIIHYVGNTTAALLRLKRVTQLHNEKEIPSGVVLPKTAKLKVPRKIGDVLVKKYALRVLINADDDGLETNNDAPASSITSFFGVEDCMPTVSFACISRLTGETIPQVAVRLAKGTLKVLDFVPDRRIPLTTKERNQLNAWNRKAFKTGLPPAPPEKGYSIVGDNWHRSATVLLQDTRKKATYLLGVDEGSYFGCELPHHVPSVPKAFEALMPEEVRKFGKHVERQGEWFFLPVDQKNVPSISKCLLISENDVVLQRDNDDSAAHTLTSVDTRVGLDGKVYAYCPNLVHEEGDHVDVGVNGWCQMVRNTALRSVSVKGVD
jgi:hypothetical protein